MTPDGSNPVMTPDGGTGHSDRQEEGTHMGAFEDRLAEGYRNRNASSLPGDMSRLAVALRNVAHDEGWCHDFGYWHAVAHGAEDGNDEPEAAERVAAAIIAADPTIVCPDPADHALAAAVLRLMERDSLYWYMADDGEKWWVVTDYEMGAVGDGPTALDAVTAALANER